MKTIITTITAFVIILTIMTMPSFVRAVSISDNIAANNNNNNNNNSSRLPSSGSTERPETTNGTRTIVLTAVPESAIIKAGDTQTIDIKAALTNGTGIPDVTIQSVVVDYETGKQKVLLGGQTNEKGELKISAAIGPHALPGQFLVTVQGEKDNAKSQISTGFALADSGSASGKSSSTKCSGSSCK